ncbi:fatty acid synthase-like isoform X2 [Photinus pyralis]|uniref:fatty acid synthase-like isoform X2 n=1 Tax=Photinus pyralis TaxID=7054 RepID=UPI001266FE3F|nr:fatty acid synthase-like isoform X2 [Photinus pyralis]
MSLRGCFFWRYVICILFGFQKLLGMEYNTEIDLAHPPLGEEIVITGMAGCFPESSNVYEFAANLYNKVDMVTADERRGRRTCADVPERLGKIPIINQFDAGYFGVCHEEADQMDPKLRIMFEKTYEAIADSGYDVRELAHKRVAVLVANSDSDTEDRALLFPWRRPNFAVTGCCRSMFAQRISYRFQFAGPSYSLDTGCSSALHALEHAYRAMREQRCDHAIVVGGQLCLNDITTLSFVRLKMVGARGTCRVFDEKADGYVRSEALAAIHVQKARDARRIYAQVSPFAVATFPLNRPFQVVHVKTNCDGYKEQGLIAPSTEMQRELFEDLYSDCKINPASIDFVEAHGTGTQIGDELESLAVEAVFCKNQKKPLLIGSVKSAAGHTEPASFLTSLVKVLLAMERDQISPNIHLETARICIEALARGRFKVPIEVTSWPENGTGLVAINSFGFGGSNAHILLKRFEKRKSEGDSLPRIVCVSGRTEQAVGEVLHDIRSRKLDAEFCGLVQRALKDAHHHRGFIIHSQLGEIQSAMGVRQRREYCLIFSDAPAEIVEIGKKLYELKAFGDAIRRVDASLEELVAGGRVPGPKLARVSLTIQLSFVDLLKEVHLPIKGRAVAYANGELTLEQAVSNRSGEARLKNPQDLIVISFGSTAMTFASQVNISVDRPVVALLELLGDAYLMGYTVHPDRLYPPMSWPVGKGTPMISPLIKWNHDTDWYTVLQTPRPSEHKVSVQIKDTVWSCLPGYKIDGLPSFPMTGYLYIIWERFTKMRNIPLENSCVSFQNVKFRNAAHISKTFGDVYVQISKITHKFELYDSGTLSVTGSISTVENWRGGVPGDFQLGNVDDRLYTQDIYKKLRLRGYNYSGAFCGLVESDIFGGVTKLKWGSNWVTFVDGLLQAKLLHEDTRELHLPTVIDDLTVDASKLSDYPAGADHALVHCRTAGIIGSQCVDLRGLSTMAVPRRKCPKPVIETYTFVPLQVELPTEVTVRVFVQIYLESSHTLHVKVVEVGEGDLAPFFEQALDHHSLVTSTIAKSSNLENHNQCGIIVVSEASTNPTILRSALDSLRPGGVVITREKPSFRTSTLPGVTIVSVAKTGSETLVLLKRTEHISTSKLITVTNKLDWLADVQETVKDGEEALLLVYSEPLCGILGLIKCLRCEPGGAHLRCIFIMDHGVRFNLGDKFFAEQLQLGLAINVLKNGVWGTYRHLLLEQGGKVERQHIFGEFSTPENRSSFKWVEGPLTIHDQVEPNMVMVQVHCAAIDFDTRGTPASRDRFPQSNALGFEFSGIVHESVDNRGRRVMGMAANGALSTLVLADRRLLWEIPQEWSFEEAASVPFTYGTALYGIVHLAKVTCGESILIHPGESEIGHAVLHVARYYKCDIYTTADSWRQRQLIRGTFPEIPDNHIGGSGDGSFEEIVLKHTQGRGVDIVLNSWSTNREASLRCLSRKGRFIEIGKCESGIEMSFLSHGRTISTLPDLFSARCPSLDVVNGLLKDALVKGLVIPSRVKTCAPDDLYRNVATGKLIVQIRPAPLQAFPRFWCDSQMTYVVIGGLGGVGLELVDWLVLRGGQKFVLVSRSGIVKGYASLRVKLWRSYGVVVRVLTDDTTCREGCSSLLRNAATLGPIAGIFNLASVVTDHCFEDQTEEGFITAFTPKAYITRNLDLVSRELCPSLRHFVVFSTIACGRGNIGQEAYGMANSIAERICESRRKDGLPGLAIQWGPIIEVGTEVGNQSRAELLLGVGQQSMSSCLSRLDTFLLQPEPVVASTVISKKRKGTEAPTTLATAIKRALGITSLKTVSENATLSELGMDSLSFVEVKQILEKELDLFLTAREVREFTFHKLKELVPEANLHLPK